MENALREIRKRATEDDSDTPSLRRSLARIALARREVIAPLVRLEAALHPWVAYGIMPLFALANAGVRVGGVDLASPVSIRIVLGVAFGLVLGKPLGILAASYIAVRARIAALPYGVTWRGVLLVGIVAGIGFTMAIFIAGLAFPDATNLGAAKLGVLLASAVASALGLAGGRALLRTTLAPDVAAITVDEAEASTER
jgi:NhaA family Na+:H+ antiporter